MPKLSPTGDTGNLGDWHVKEGGYIDAGEAYCDVITDKATVTYDAIEPGYIAKILVKPHTSNITIGDIIGVQVEEEEDIETFKNFTANDFTSTEKKEEKSQPGTTSKTEEKEVKLEKIENEPLPIPKISDKEETFASPLAKVTAINENIDLSKIIGTGFQNAIKQRDVLAKTNEIKASKESKPISFSSSTTNKEENYKDIIHTPMRKTIATRLLESKQMIPHYNLTIDCCADNIFKIRKEFIDNNSTKISINDFIIKAAAMTLKKVNDLNSSWNDKFIRIYENIDISIAVSTNTGLITPIIKDANKKTLSEISAKVKELVKKAKDGKLMPNEYEGGTFTISNLGMMGVKDFSAIINPPHSSILAIGSTRRVVNHDVEKDKFGSNLLFSATLSCDHRVVDGAKGAEWLKVFKEYISDPKSMLL